VPYKLPNAASVEERYKDPDGLWTGWYIGIFGFVLNTDRFAKEMRSVTKPATWDDLLDAAWKDKLACPEPVKTGGGYIFIATQIFRFYAVQAAARATTSATEDPAKKYDQGEALAMDYMKKLHANISQYAGTAPQAI
jgi:iron(III) transport system substrate-binding protein